LSLWHIATFICANIDAMAQNDEKELVGSKVNGKMKSLSE